MCLCPQNGTMSKMSKFEIELPVVPKPAKLCLSERDIAMATMSVTTMSRRWRFGLCDVMLLA